MQKLILPALILFFFFSGAWFLAHTPEPMTMGEGGEHEQKTGGWIDKYEWILSRDPNTGRVPDGIRKRELAWVKTLQPRQTAMMSALANNTYAAVGPSVNGGRTRAIGVDVRYNGTTNKVVIAGGVNGGIFRSEDGGYTWTFVHPSDEVRSVTCVAQDPRPGFQDIWYAGTGEQNQTAEYPNTFVLGFGMFKSIDNGKTWTKLPSTALGTEFNFDSFFDLTFNIAVHPVTGDVYVAAQQAIVRSQNGGISWTTVLTGAVSTNRLQGVTDVKINKAGTKIYAAFSGRNPNRDIAGVWMSSTGAAAYLDKNCRWNRKSTGFRSRLESL